MIIDVVDLNFETLHFNRSYDLIRYKKGTDLYNKGLSTVKEVNQIDEDNYLIKASVRGNYDLYTATLEICGNTINKSTCTCEDYNRGNLCKHIIATSMEVIKPHQASTEEGKRRIEREQKEEARRKLEERRRKQEQERKKREYERKYYNGLKTIELYKQSSRKEGESVLDLAQLYEMTTEIKNRKTRKLATSVKLECRAEIENLETLKISFKIGQTRMYMLNNICEFYEAYKNGSELYYGKQLRFVPKRENFEEDSQRMFDYIIKYAEMVSYNNTYGDYRMASSFNKVIYITKENIDDFFAINKDKEMLISSYYDGDSKYKLTEDKLDIACVLKKEKITERKVKSLKEQDSK